MKTASPLSVGKTCTGKEYAMQDLAVTLSGYLSKLSLPSLGVTDILEIALISFFYISVYGMDKIYPCLYAA